MIRIADPARIGPALAQVRELLGITRVDVARAMAENTGRRADPLATQLGQWERLENSITMRSLGPWLDALGYDLALVPREDA